jgi:electron transfer flavoprotein beta subunit
MKIAVCIKHVPAGRLRLDAETRRLDRSGPGELNRVDANAVEAALQLHETHGGEVVVVSMGPPAAVETVRSALGMGGDRAVLVNDPAAEGSDLLATSRVLAAALSREDPDLVLFGQQSIDGAGAMLWAAVADRVGMPVISQAAELVVHDGGVRVVRQSEFGDDVIEAPLPAIVAVSDALNEPRYASLKGMMGAKRKPLDQPTVAELGLAPETVGAAGSGTEVLAVGPPPSRGEAEWVENEEEAPEKIVDFLSRNQLL